MPHCPICPLSMFPIIHNPHHPCPRSKSSRYWHYLLKVFTKNHRSMILHMKIVIMCPIYISQKRFPQDDEVSKTCQISKSQTPGLQRGFTKKETLWGSHILTLIFKSVNLIMSIYLMKLFTPWSHKPKCNSGFQWTEKLSLSLLD